MTIFGLNMMVKSGLEKIILKSLLTGRWLFLLLNLWFWEFYEVRENKLQFEIWNSKNRFLAELKIQDIIWLPDTLEYSPILPLSLRWIFALFFVSPSQGSRIREKAQIESYKYILVHG